MNASVDERTPLRPVETPDRADDVCGRVLQHVVTTDGLDRTLVRAFGEEAGHDHHAHSIDAAVAAALTAEGRQGYGGVTDADTSAVPAPADALHPPQGDLYYYSETSSTVSAHPDTDAAAAAANRSVLSAFRGTSSLSGPASTLHEAHTRQRLVNPIFSRGGRFAATTIGVQRTSKGRGSWYHYLVQQSWGVIALAGAGMYLAAGLTLGLLYLLAARHCGAQATPIVALYFFAVSLSANGGYMGEDEAMTRVGTRCYEHRAYIVLLASYLNVLIVALIAAVFVAKASAASQLRHRIAFSDLAVVREVENFDLATGQDITTAPQSPAANSLGNVSHSVLAHHAFQLLGSWGHRHRRPHCADASDIERIAYVLQCRVGNLDQAVGQVLSGELRLFLVVEEITDRKRHGVSVRTYELPWCAEEEDHEEDCDDSVAMNGRNTSKSLRLWVPVLASIVVDRRCSSYAVRLLHNLLLRHSREQFSTRCMPADGANVDRIFDFQIVAEYRAEDSVTGGASFVARHAYGPAALLRRFRFSDTCVFLTEEALSNVRAGGRDATASRLFDLKTSHKEASLEVDFRRFNAVEADA